ncbi:unnamed protein product, partial [Linum tenue]
MGNHEDRDRCQEYSSCCSFTCRRLQPASNWWWQKEWRFRTCVFGRISTTATSTHVVLRIAPAVVAQFIGHAAPADFLSLVTFPRVALHFGFRSSWKGLAVGCYEP